MQSPESLESDSQVQANPFPNSQQVEYPSSQLTTLSAQTTSLPLDPRKAGTEIHEGMKKKQRFVMYLDNLTKPNITPSSSPEDITQMTEIALQAFETACQDQGLWNQIKDFAYDPFCHCTYLNFKNQLEYKHLSHLKDILFQNCLIWDEKGKVKLFSQRFKHLIYKSPQLDKATMSQNQYPQSQTSNLIIPPVAIDHLKELLSKLIQESQDSQFLRLTEFIQKEVQTQLHQKLPPPQSDSVDSTKTATIKNNKDKPRKGKKKVKY